MMRTSFSLDDYEVLETVGPEIIFRCNFCISDIPQDSPVYMRHDNCYCSPLCREKGNSCIFEHFRRAQLLHQEAKGQPSGSLLSSNTKSDSSITSRATTHRTGVSNDNAIDKPSLGPLGWIGRAVFDTLLQRVASKSWGNQILRNYSNGVGWGR